MFNKGYDAAKTINAMPIGFVRAGTGSKCYETATLLIEGNTYCMIVNKNNKCPTRTFRVFLSNGKTKNWCLATPISINDSMAFIGVEHRDGDRIERGHLFFSQDTLDTFLEGASAYLREKEAANLKEKQDAADWAVQSKFDNSHRRSKWSGAAAS